MRSSFAIRISFVFCAIATASVSPAAPPVLTVYNPDHLYIGTFTWDPFQGGGLGFGYEEPIAFPISGSASTASYAGDTHSKATVDGKIIGDQYVVSIDFDHSRDAPTRLNDEPVAGILAIMNFSVDRDTHYEFAGFYNVTDADLMSYGYVSMQTELSYYVPLGEEETFIYQNGQWSDSTPNERLVMATKGFLKKDEVYQIAFASSIGWWDFVATGTPNVATAVGNFTFKIGEATVPEPSTFFMLLPAAALLFRRRR